MRIIRFLNESSRTVLGIWEPNSEMVKEISSVDSSLQDIITIHKAAKMAGVTSSDWINTCIEGKVLKTYRINKLTLLTPVDAPEVWACGVTYQRSRQARNEEHSVKDLKETFYDKVYSAPRPEIFFKSTNLRTIAPNQLLTIRSDSHWMVPEPEIGLVLSSDREIIGFTIGNDMSSRDIEGENPLYLPQAKIWDKSCSFGPSILLTEAIEDPYNLDIICRILRQGNIIFEGSANTNQLNRKYEELVSYLGRDNIIFDGTVLLTGTCVVPSDDFTLQSGDRIEIEVPPIGILMNTIA